MQRLIPIIILIAVQVYLFHRIQKWLSRADLSLKRTLLLVPLLYICVTIFFMIGNRFPEEPLSSVELYSLAYPFWLWVLPTTLAVLPVFLLRDLIVLGLRGRSPRFQHATTEPKIPVVEPPPEALSRRQFLRYATTGIITAPIALTAYGTMVGTQRYDIHKQEIPFPDLPESLDGLRILQISDVHANMYMTLDDMKDLVALINDLPSDLIVLTGDYVSGTADFIFPFCEAFKKMHRPALGMYATLGNHDHWTNEDKITRALTDIQINVLRNHTAVLPIGDTHLNLIGIDYGDLKKGSRERRGLNVTWPAIGGLLDQAMKTTQAGGFNILLSHSPWGYHDAIARGIPLTLSGHTHGGQVVLRLPGFALSPATFLYPYTEGLYRNDTAALYVNRGCGTTGPPVRINCKPEITVITLIRG
jgi:predicted MPP superfamily phosphohydrolase